MTSPNTPFFKFILSGQNRIYLGFTIPFAIVSFIILRNLYPIPSFYSDSFTWVGAAISRQPISFRPVGYSKLLIFFRYFSSTAVALVAGQYAVTLLTNLFLFFTFAWFFPLKNVYKALLYILLIVNPFYLFASNYVYSDAFFNPLSVLWFTLFIWILHKPSPFYIILQIILLACLFNLRYNAIVFPGISAVGILLTSSSYKKKAVAIAANFMVIIAIWIFTTYQTKSYTGIKTFSAFSGWQLANDAIHVLRHSTIDTLAIKDEEVKAVTTYTIHFFDTTKTFFADTSASALYMWERVGPLKKYMYVYPKRNRSYFKTWNALGPVYSKFGQTIILQHPFVYLKHFAIPNAKAYFLPPLEAYATYMENRTTIPGVVTKFYKYKSNKTPKHYPGVYAFVFTPMQALFTVANILFLAIVSAYVFKKHYRKESALFNRTLLCFGALYVVNFFFVVLLAPTVLRYHIFLLTLLFPVLFYLIQQLTVREKQVTSVEKS